MKYLPFSTYSNNMLPNAIHLLSSRYVVLQFIDQDLKGKTAKFNRTSKSNQKKYVSPSPSPHFVFEIYAYIQ